MLTRRARKLAEAVARRVLKPHWNVEDWDAQPHDTVKRPTVWQVTRYRTDGKHEDMGLVWAGSEHEAIATVIDQQNRHRADIGTNPQRSGA